jgi:hypothetical protein
MKESTEMDFRTNRIRQALAMLGACFGLLLLASPANARPDGFQPQLKSEESSDAFTRYLANHRAHEEQVTNATRGDGDQSDAVTRYLTNLRAGEQAYHATRTGIPDSVAAALQRNADAATEQTTVIPYLSHGEGVIVGEDGVPEPTPTVIPYLSHGIGVTSSDATATLRDDPDGFQPQLHSVDSAPVADDGFDWETTGFITGGILAAMLLALMSTIALRDRRGLKSA